MERMLCGDMTGYHYLVVMNICIRQVILAPNGLFIITHLSIPVLVVMALQSCVGSGSSKLVGDSQSMKRKAEALNVFCFFKIHCCKIKGIGGVCSKTNEETYPKTFVNISELKKDDILYIHRLMFCFVEQWCKMNAWHSHKTEIKVVFPAKVKTSSCICTWKNQAWWKGVSLIPMAVESLLYRIAWWSIVMENCHAM